MSKISAQTCSFFLRRVAPVCRVAQRQDRPLAYDWTATASEILWSSGSASSPSDEEVFARKGYRSKECLFYDDFAGRPENRDEHPHGWRQLEIQLLLNSRGTCGKNS